MALGLGFGLGFFWARPRFMIHTPQTEIQQEGDFNQVSPLPSGQKTTEKKSAYSATPTTRKWDEKTIQGLPLREVQSRLQELSAWAPGAQTDKMELRLVKRWASLEPTSACQYAYQAVLQGADESLLVGPLEIWAGMDPAGASRWAAALGSPSVRDLSVRTVYQTWAQTDSSAALKSISLLKPASARGTATAATAPPHAQKSFPSAMQWARSLPGPLREKTLDAILGEWSRRDPPGAANWLIQQPGDIQWAMISKLAADWVKKDPYSALSWGLGQSAEVNLGSKLAVGPVQRKFFEAALGALIGTDPQAAANWLASPIGEPFLTSRIGSVAARWTSMDPLEAAGWSLSLPRESDRTTALGAVAGTWAKTDPQAAGQWISGLAQTGQRDTALSAYCNSLSPYDAAAAAQWAERISSPEIRKNTILAAINRWRQYDPNAARQFISTTPSLDQNTKAYLLR